MCQSVNFTCKSWLRSSLSTLKSEFPFNSTSCSTNINFTPNLITLSNRYIQIDGYVQKANVGAYKFIIFTNVDTN